MSFEFKILSENKYAEIDLTGKLLEKTEATELMVAIDDLLHQKVNKFILNLDALDYLNSSGLSCFITILTKVRNEGGEITLINIAKKIEDLMLMTKLNSIFHVSENLEHAIDYVTA